MLLDFLILLSVRPNEQEIWTKKIIDYLNEDISRVKELRELCDINNYTSPYKAHTIAHNAQVLMDMIQVQLEE